MKYNDSSAWLTIDRNEMVYDLTNSELRNSIAAFKQLNALYPDQVMVFVTGDWVLFGKQIKLLRLRGAVLLDIGPKYLKVRDDDGEVYRLTLAGDASDDRLGWRRISMMVSKEGQF